MVLFSLSKLCINKWPSRLVPSECLLRLSVVFHQDEPSPVPYAPANILIQFKGHVLFKLTEPSKVLTSAPLSLTPYRQKGIKKTITLRKLDHVNWLEKKMHLWRGGTFELVSRSSRKEISPGESESLHHRGWEDCVRVNEDIITFPREASFPQIPNECHLISLTFWFEDSPTSPKTQDWENNVVPKAHMNTSLITKESSRV